jgi:CelD/BcsL family acetyltransferase involved in cellulose biosynthesis
MILHREAPSLPAALESNIDPELKPPLQTQRSGQPKIHTRFIDPLSSGNEWDRMVTKHSSAHFFHSAAWARVLARTYGHRPFYLVATQEDKTVALLPLMEVRSRLSGVRGVSLPFSDFCAPLFFGEEGYETAVAAAVELGRVRGWKHLELRGSAGSTISARGSVSYYTHALDLRHSERELFERCASSVRRGVRKAEGNALAVEIESSRRALREFYRLHCQTRRTHGLPPQPWTFFEYIHDEILQAGNGCVIVARQQGKAIAAAVFFRFGKHSLYKFGASDADAARVRANNLVIWEGIKFWAHSGAEFLHFGRTDPGHDGLRRFKRSWGSIEEPLQYLRFDFRQGRWMVVEQAPLPFQYQLFRHLPLPLNRVAGAMIYPHLD